MSNKGAKGLAIGGLIVIGCIATAPIGGAVLGSTIMLGTLSLDPIIWAVIGISSIKILVGK